jgi:hypothetical protein
MGQVPEKEGLLLPEHFPYHPVPISNCHRHNQVRQWLGTFFIGALPGG